MPNTIDDAPTPQNTPASAAGSYMPSHNAPTSLSTIDEKNELLQSLLSNNPQLLQSIQDKLGTLIGKDSGYFHSLSKSTKEHIYALKTLQLSQFKIEAEFQSELLELEKKFQLKYQPIYKKRLDIIKGVEKLDSKDIEEGKNLIDEEGIDEEDEEGEGEEEEKPEDNAEENDQPGVPSFWLTAMQNLPPIADMITERDIEVLESLVDIRMEYMDIPGFKLIFQFEENEFFTNKEITKTYYYQKQLGYTGEFIYDHAEGDKINWKSNSKNVTVEIELRKQRNKHTKQVRTIEKTSPIISFFNFFTPPSMPEIDGDEDEEFQDIDEELEAELQNDYSIGELIKEKLIPRAVDWFTGHALQYEPEFQPEDGEYDDEDEDDYEEGDEDDEDDDEDDEGDGNSAEKPECKQQ